MIGLSRNLCLVTRMENMKTRSKKQPSTCLLEVGLRVTFQKQQATETNSQDDIREPASLQFQGTALEHDYSGDLNVT